MVPIQYLPTGTVHGVRAGGGPQDGSLYGFPTACGDEIVDLDLWSEQPGIEITCKVCLRAKHADEARPTLTPPQHKTLEALYAGGYIAIGTAGGMTGFVYPAHGAMPSFAIQSNTGKALLSRRLIQLQSGKGYVITTAGCHALGRQPLSQGG